MSSDTAGAATPQCVVATVRGTALLNAEMRCGEGIWKRAGASDLRLAPVVECGGAGDLNPRPQAFFAQIYMFSGLI